MSQVSVHPYKGDPRFIESGRDGARRRWGPRPRLLRLDALPEPVRAAIEAMVAAEANARAREAGESDG